MKERRPCQATDLSFDIRPREKEGLFLLRSVWCVKIYDLSRRSSVLFHRFVDSKCFVSKVSFSNVFYAFFVYNFFKEEENRFYLQVLSNLTSI